MGLIRQNKRYKLFNNFTCYTIYTHDSEKPLVGSYLVGAYILSALVFNNDSRSSPLSIRLHIISTIVCDNYLLHIYSRYNYPHIFDSRKILI